MKITIETEKYETAANIIENIPAEFLKEGDILRIQLPEKVVEYVYRTNWCSNQTSAPPPQSR